MAVKGFMNCCEFKKYWIDGDIDDLDFDLQEKVIDHLHSCLACKEAVLVATLEKRGVKVSDYPCVHMAQYAEFSCEQHPDPRDCEDATIRYDEKYDEYPIPHGDKNSQMIISNCPWCGTKLPDSKRNLWFDTLESIGFDDPWEQEIPDMFKSKQWRKISKRIG